MPSWQRGLYWKLVVCLPVTDASEQSSSLSDWIRHKLSVGSVPSKPANSEVMIAVQSSSSLAY